MSVVPEVQVKSGFGSALPIALTTLGAIVLVIAATIWWLKKIAYR